MVELGTQLTIERVKLVTLYLNYRASSRPYLWWGRPSNGAVYPILFYGLLLQFYKQGIFCLLRRIAA